MKKQFLLGLSLVLIAVFVSGCDAFFANSSPPSENEQVDNQLWLTPLFDTPDPDSSGPLPPPIAFPGNGGDQPSQAPEYAIATPLVPSFKINSAELHFCNAQTYVKIQVENNGPYYFQFVRIYLEHGGQMFQYPDWKTYDVWVLDGSACPVPAPANPSLGPGASAYIYFPITPIFPNIEYDIQLRMCTFNTIPDYCPIRYHVFEEDIWPLKVAPELHLEETVLCRWDLDLLYEVVNSLPEGTSVELLGKGDVEGFLVVQEPKYQRACWMRSEGAQDIPEEALLELTTYDTPILAAEWSADGSSKTRMPTVRLVGLMSASRALRYHWHLDHAAAQARQPPQPQTAVAGIHSQKWNRDHCVYTTRPNTCRQLSTADSYDLSVDWGAVLEKTSGWKTAGNY